MPSTSLDFDNIKVGGASDAFLEKYNEEAFDNFNNNILVPCPNCARTFLPDRLVVHSRSCKPKGLATQKHLSAKAQMINTEPKGIQPKPVVEFTPEKKTRKLPKKSGVKKTKVRCSIEDKMINYLLKSGVDISIKDPKDNDKVIMDARYKDEYTAIRPKGFKVLI